MAGLIDTHLHLYREEFDADRAEAWERANRAGVLACVHIGYNHETNEQAQQIRANEPAAWATAGVHPHDAESWSDEESDRIQALAEAGKIVAVGECGLDWYRDLSPRDRQEQAFRAQIRLAHKLDLPMIHHVRDAWPAAREVLEDEGLPPKRGVFHAFAGDAEFAHWAVDAGYRLGIGGVLTYKSSSLAEVVADLPPESLLPETDAPWLPPQPWRGRRNEPAYLRHTAAKLAEALGRDLDELSGIWAAEFERVFGVELPAPVLACRLSDCPEPEPARRRK